MCAKARLTEKQILIFSSLLALVFALSGLIIGLLMNSLVIVFDGVYSLISLLLTLLSLVAAKYMHKSSNKHSSHKRALIEPVVIAIKGATILMLVCYSLFSAIHSLFNGGHTVDAGVATLFELFSVIGCGYAWWHIAYKSRAFTTGLVQAEVKQWQMDTLLSLIVMVGFIVAWLMSYTPLAQYSVYADPIMMITMSFYFIKVPLYMLIDAIRELLTLVIVSNEDLPTGYINHV